MTFYNLPDTDAKIYYDSKKKLITIDGLTDEDTVTQEIKDGKERVVIALAT